MVAGPRRGFLSGIAATVLGLASGREEPSRRASRSDAPTQQDGGNNNGGSSGSGGSGVLQHDHSGSGQGGSTVVAEQLIHSARDTNTHASRNRPVLSTAPKDTYVDPDRGDDSNDGSQGAPLASLQEALGRLPIVIQHNHHIYLANGTYDGGKPVSAPLHIAGGKHQPNPMRIQGNPDDPSKVVIDNNVMLSSFGNEMDNAVLRDVTITGSLQNVDSHFQVQNIRFTGTNAEAVLGGAAFKTHDPSITMLRDCSFTENYDYAADVSLGARLMMDDCTGNVSQYGVLADKGSTVTDIDDNDLTGAQGYIDIGSATRYVPEDGPVRTSGSNGSSESGRSGSSSGSSRSGGSNGSGSR
jgi:hypothetical protein